MVPLIEFKNVSIVRDGSTILDLAGLRIEQNEHVAILGPNGSGKSTLIRLLTREIHPYAGRGSVRVLGKDRWVLQELRTILGLVSFDPGDKLLGRPTALEMAVSGLLGSYGVLFGHDVTPGMIQKGCRALERVEAGHLAERRFETLSSGEARRVLIARALVSEPRALVLDEPTTSLDLKASDRFRETMRSIARQGTALILVTHHLEEVVPEIERVVLLSEGRILMDGPKALVLTANNLSRAFGAEIDLELEPFPHARVK
jgi:iron complex transport system ATP-binding protein